MEFSSLKQALEGSRTMSSYPAIYGAYRDLQRMVRVGDYKLIAYPQAGIRRLYNLEDDPLEMNDLAAMPESGDLMISLQEQLSALMVEMGDTLDLGKYSFHSPD